ncbi:hypothetical protein BCT40_08810 [Vibrio lentus]|nr:hypothetical protein BCT40_08810 [Vibrio lentus]
MSQKLMHSLEHYHSPLLLDFEYLVRAKTLSLGVKVEVTIQVIATKLINGDIEYDDGSFTMLISHKEDDL